MRPPGAVLYAAPVLRAALSAVRAEPRVEPPAGRPWWDVALVAVLIPASVVETLVRDDLAWPVVSLALALVCVLALLWRRTHPLAAVVAAYGAQTVAGLGPDLAGRENGVMDTTACVLLLLWSLGRWASGPSVVVGTAFVLVAHLVREPFYEASGASIVVGAGFLLLPVVLGVAVRLAITARQRQQGQVRLREREQLARELHDTVAHHVSGIVIQAQAGQAVAAADPAKAAEVLGVIEVAATRALGEMRAIVGILRDGAEAERAPVPGVAALRGLVADPDARPPATLVLDGDLEDLDPAIDAAVFRVVQESLTNARRHARHATHVDVHVRRDGRRVLVEVVDDGRAGARPGDDGFGLTGMAERAALLGGTFTAGPRAAGGWAVTAELPLPGGSP